VVRLRSLGRAVVLGGLLLASQPLPDPGVAMIRWGKAVSAVRTAGIPETVKRAPPKAPEPVPEKRALWTPRPPMVPFPVFDWNATHGALPGALDRVRQETGDEVTPLDFQGSGGVDQAMVWMGGGAWTPPSWLRTTLRSHATPRGTDLDLNLFFHWDEWKVVLGIRNQTSMTGYTVNGYFPGLNLEVYEYPLHLSRLPVLVTPRVSVWSQPMVPTDLIQAWGLLGSLTLEVPLQENLWVWLEGQGKSAGWVADNQALGPELMFKTGLHWSL